MKLILASLKAFLCLESPGKVARFTGVLMNVGRLVTDLNLSLTTLPSPGPASSPSWATVMYSDPAAAPRPVTRTNVQSSQNCEVPKKS